MGGIRARAAGKVSVITATERSVNPVFARLILDVRPRDGGGDGPLPGITSDGGSRYPRSHWAG